MHDLLAVIDHVQAVAQAASSVAIPDPGQGVAPPGSQRLEKMLGWVAWLVFGLCVCGVLMVAGRMAISHQRGEGMQHMGGLAIVGGACFLAGSAALLVKGVAG